MIHTRRRGEPKLFKHPTHSKASSPSNPSFSSFIPPGPARPASPLLGSSTPTQTPTARTTGWLHSAPERCGKRPAQTRKVRGGALTKTSSLSPASPRRTPTRRRGPSTLPLLRVPSRPTHTTPLSTISHLRHTTPPLGLGVMSGGLRPPHNPHYYDTAHFFTYLPSNTLRPF